ncbi:PREDICTED: mucin-5AC-like [Nipponia nippon]|uniref:mucin-5AC-like n=1 Tax=Nipponia nippon TaxID=128390 RepID=UPI000510FE86|nr:PREDICTED: mucin-5AC-like [Nipponia nippon]
MGCWGQWPLWSWVLWGLWVLPAELGSVSPAADSTSAELPLELGTCQVLPTTAAAQPEHPSLASRTTSTGSHGSGSLVPQVTARVLVPAKTSDPLSRPWDHRGRGVCRRIPSNQTQRGHVLVPHRRWWSKARQDPSSRHSTNIFPWGSRSAPLAVANPSPVLATATPLPNAATGKTPQPVTPPPRENAAVEGGGVRSQLAGDGSTMQAALGSTPAENTRAGATTGTPHSSDTTLGTTPPASPPARASVTARPSVAASDHSYRTAEPTMDTNTGMDLDMDTASPTTGNGAAGLPLGLPTPMAGVAEPGTGDATPSARSTPGSKSPLAVAIVGTVSPTAPEPVIASSPGLAYSTSEPDVSVSPPVRRNTHAVLVAPSITPSIAVTGPAAEAGDANLDRVTTPPSAVSSSASTPRSPRVTPRLSPEATDSTHDPALRALSPVTEDEPTTRISSLGVGHTHTWETTAASRSSAGGITAWADTTPSESSAKSAAPPADTNSTHVPVSNTTGTSPATTPAASVIPSNTIPPATSASGETFVVTEATTAVPTATVKAASTSSALSLTVTHDEAGRGQPVLSPAVRTPSLETTAKSWGVLGASPAAAVPGSSLTSPHSPAEEPATIPSSLLGVGATGEPAAGQTPPEPATGVTSPTAVSSNAMGQAASTSPPGFWTSLGAPAWRETTAIGAGSATAITAGSTTAIAAGSTMAITAGSTTAIAAGSTTTIAAGSTVATAAGSTTAIAPGSTMAIAASSTTTITAGSTAAITASGTATTAAGSTTTIAAGSTTAITAGHTVAVAPTAPVSPAKDMGDLLAPGTMAPGRPPVTTSPGTTLAPAFGTQRGPATAPSTSAHTTTGHRNPTPEPQPTHRLISK